MPTTTISTQVSTATASWLEQEARSKGADVAQVAALILEERAGAGVSTSRTKDSSELTPEKRIKAFAEFTRQLKPGLGRHVDDSRESIYEE